MTSQNGNIKRSQMPPTRQKNWAASWATAFAAAFGVAMHSGAGVVPPQSGQLAAGQFIPAFMPMSNTTVVWPRPDTETTAKEYSRIAHSTMPYIQPIEIQGGSWPFWFNQTTGPGSIGQYYTSTNYGSVVVPTPGSGTLNFSVDCFDQVGVKVTVAWSATVDDTKFIFVSPSGNDTTGAGTILLPYLTYAKARTVATAGQCIVFRAGTYVPPVFSGISMAATTHLTLMAYPGETVVMNMAGTNSTQGMWTMDAAGCTVIGIQFTGALLGTNPRHFVANTAGSRLYMLNCSFSDNGGTSGTDNSACWFLPDPGGQRSYIAQIGCSFDHLPTSSNGYNAIVTYQCQYLLIRGNIYGDMAGISPQHSFYVKGSGNNNVSFRGNIWSVGTLTSLGFAFGADGSGSPASNNQEMTFNLILGTSAVANWTNFPIMINQAQNSSAPINMYSGRNTIFGLACIYNNIVNTLTFSSVNDVIVSNVTGIVGLWVGVDFNTGATVFKDPRTITGITYSITGIECQGNSSAGILDASWNLANAFKTNYRTLRGRELP